MWKRLGPAVTIITVLAAVATLILAIPVIANMLQSQVTILVFDQFGERRTDVTLVGPKGERRNTDGSGVVKVPESWKDLTILALDATTGKELGEYKLAVDRGRAVLRISR